ncbi:hypothetical protein FB451DRAFT_1478478 [Mycena latifolia]|nr:hypothetical protein FB451DRAFT_1478478 [Mycena latifolia]
MSPTDWERPLFYSRRVKRLFLYQTMLVISTTAFEAISLSCPGHHMFPNLQTLVLNLMTHKSLSATSLDFLISPHLEEIRLYFGTRFRLLCQIVPTLAVKCPSLTCVGISMDKSYDARTLKVVSDFVRSLARIQDLAVTNIDQDAFKRLGGLASLKVLELEDPKVPWMPALPIDGATSPQHMYSSLTDLYFGDSTTVDQITAVINIISNAQLKRLEFELLDDAGPSDAIGRLYSALTTHCSHVSLQDISMRGAWPSGSASMDQYRIHGATLRTLFCFGNMVSVELHQCSGFDLDDADIFDMARAWPRLEFLALIGYLALKPRVTVQGLYAFAQQCPNLDYLAIMVDATVVVPEPRVGSVSQDTLRTLSVSRSPIQVPNAVVAFLSAIFPRVNVDSDFYYEDPGSEELEYRDRWAEVKQSLKDFRAQKNLDQGGN